MLEAFRLGGWGMYPTLVFGLFLLSSAFRYAIRPLRGSLAVVRMLSLLTIAAGGLGFVTGLMKTLKATAEESNQITINKMLVQGTYESLHNIALALVLLVCAGIVAAIGAKRAARQGVEIPPSSVAVRQ